MGNTINKINEMAGVPQTSRNPQVPREMTAPAVDTFIHTLYRDSLIVNESAILRMKRLFLELKKIKSIGDNEQRVLWLEVPKGTIDDFGDYEEALEYGDVKDRGEFEQWWKAEYPKETYWYEFDAAEHDGYMAVFLQNRLVLEANPRERDAYDRYGEALNPFIEWLTASVKNCIEKLKAGTYNDYVRRHLDVSCRTGTILRSDYWKAYPESKAEYLKDFAEDDLNDFIRYMEEAADKEPNGKIQNMTSGLFFQCCAFGYEANYGNTGKLSPRELYQKYADGRDEGLCEVNEDNPEAFEQWYMDRDRHGGHPWEVCRGGNSTHVDLYAVRTDGGYYFHVAGNAWNRSVEAAKFYLAIRRAGYPVTIRDGQALADRFLGKDKIGIVPKGVFTRYCESYFPNEKILDFINLDEEDEEKLLEYIEWQEIPEVYLA